MIFATGSRVMWRSIEATVIDGNTPDEWSNDYPFVSLKLDKPAKRGHAPYATVNATELTEIK